MNIYSITHPSNHHEPLFTALSHPLNPLQPQFPLRMHKVGRRDQPRGSKQRSCLPNRQRTCHKTLSSTDNSLRSPQF